MTSSTTPPACWVSSLSSRLPARQAPHRTPGDLSHCRGGTRLGRIQRRWKDAFLAHFDTGGAGNGPSHQSSQRHHRTRPTHRPRMSQLQQLPPPNAPHHRRTQWLPPPNTEELVNETGEGGATRDIALNIVTLFERNMSSLGRICGFSVGQYRLLCGV